MAINLKFDLLGNPEPPSIVLASRNGNKFGQLDVNVESIDVLDKLNGASELSFTLNKYIDGELTPYWDKVVDFKLIYCPEWDMWFEIKVELDEATETVKTVFGTQLGQAELSQIMLYNIEINTEADIERDDYKTSILCDENNPKSSILHRLLEKAPHYSIAYVDETIQRIQRQFSFDGTSICDAFNEIAEEIGCLFVYNSNTKFDGTPNRTISVYDLQQNCKSCGHRGEFTDKCPECGSTNIKYGYGEDTTIFVTSDELATEGIELVTDTDAVKNCFKLEAGDDLMTAAIRSCNPNGSDYIWYFSDTLKADMSDELVDKLNSYNDSYQYYYNNHVSTLNGTFVNQYNALVKKYADYYNTKSTCLDCKTEGYFQEQCTNCNSKNIITGQTLQVIPSSVAGYPNLINAYYNTIDLGLYLESGLMPNVSMSDTTAVEQISLLTSSALSPVAVNVKDINNASLTTTDSAVVSIAKAIIRPTYKVSVVDGSSSLSGVSADGTYKVWTGKLVVTNYSDESDSATSGTITVKVNNDTVTFIKQKIEKALNKENTDDYSITGLFAKGYAEFCAELKKYALNPLNSFSQACDVCLSILLEQGVGDDGSNESDAFKKAEKKALYEALWLPYYNKQQAINKEIKDRENEIVIIEGVWDNSDEENPKCTTKGLQQYIEECQKEIQDALNFENYLGESLWLEFCAYRREDKYSNDNYISDGLSNAELLEKANEFIKVAEEEIFKSAELQHSISSTLNNLLALPKFESLLKFFKTGNWIRVQADDEIYKLRLLEYGFNYGDSESISVEFSDVTKIKNGITDIQDIMSQASSMASSYDAVQRQAQKGDVARGTIDQWLIDGLDSANVRIKNNNNEEIVITKSGLLARTYGDITGTYSPEQFKLTHNIMAYTEDGWETVSTALGKHDYKYWAWDSENNENSGFQDATGYGMSAKFAQAAYIIGSQIISGEIISYNYKPKTEGTYFNLVDGDFDIAGGSIIYNADEKTLTLKNVTIEWDSATKPSVAHVDGLDKYLEKLEEVEQTVDVTKSVADNAKEIGDKLVNGLGFKETEITGQYVISPVIAGGYLLIGDTTGTYAQITTHGQLKCAGAEINGHITATSLTLGSGVTVSSDAVDGLASVATSGNYADLLNQPKIPESVEDLGLDSSTIVYKGDISQSAKIDDLGNAYLETTVPTLDADGKITYITYATYDAGSHIVFGAIGEDVVGQNYFCVEKNGLLTARNAFIYGTIYATDGEFTGTVKGSAIQGGSLLIGDESGTYAQITENGKLKCNGAEITGTAYINNGQIGGWTIGRYAITKSDATGLISGMTAHGVWIKTSTSTTNGKGYVRLFSGTSTSLVTPDVYDSENANTYKMYNNAGNFYVTSQGYMYATDAHINGTMTLGALDSDGNATYYISPIDFESTLEEYIKLPCFSATHEVLTFTSDIDLSAGYHFTIGTGGTLTFNTTNGFTTMVSAGSISTTGTISAKSITADNFYAGNSNLLTLINNNASDIGELSGTVTAHETLINTNKNNIDKLSTQITTLQSTHTSDIQDLQTQVSSLSTTMVVELGNLSRRISALGG